MFTKTLIKTVFISSLLFVTSAYAEKTNFSYSSIGLSAGTLNYKNSYCVFGSCANSGNTTYGHGSIQMGENIVLGVSGGSLKVKATNWDLDGTSRVFSAGIAFPISDKTDINAEVSSGSVDLTGCISGLCAKESYDGNSFEGRLRSWLNDKHTFSGSVGIESTKLSNESSRKTSLNFGLSLWMEQHHKFSFSYGSGDNTSETIVGYSYVF